MEDAEFVLRQRVTDAVDYIGQVGVCVLNPTTFVVFKIDSFSFWRRGYFALRFSQGKAEFVDCLNRTFNGVYVYRGGRG